MKRVVKSKHFKRSLGFIASFIAFAAIVFLFTRPLLAPELEQKKMDGEENIMSSDDSAFNNKEQNDKIGEGVLAESFLVFDESSGNILASRNPDTPVAIASITKLMTAYVTEKYGNQEDEWAITQESTNDIRPILGLKIGDRVKVKDLEYAMLIGSANDAAAALGQYIATIEKSAANNLMNQEAKALGMSSTHYENPIGFDSEQNYSTANDLKLLLRKFISSETLKSIDRSQSYSFTSLLGNPYTVKATNTLIGNDPEIHAIKTGFTDEAEGAMITAIYHQDKKFVMIILRSPNREKDTLLLKSNLIKTITQ
jgi:serine-type D-Ala-D-Ala carboxypeptidase (penicillin-binding protein 5/6)